MLGMQHRVVRISKFRNVYGTPWKRECCYDNIRVSKSSWDATFCSVSTKFIAIIVESAGGGAFIVLPITKQEKITRIKCDHPIVSGHKGPILDLAWSPHNPNLIATGSEDCSVKIWHIPEQGLTKTITEPLLALLYHQRRAGIVLWHPTAENVLLSAGSDNLIVIWNVYSGQPTIVIENHPDVIYSACWNWDGSKLLTTCKDKKLRIIDPRNGNIEEEAVGHEGSKSSRAIYLKNGLIFTTGFSKVSERQYSLREPNQLSNPMVMCEIDTSNGVIFPLYDPDTNMVYLCGKGDSVIRYFEVTPEAPFVHYISTFQTPDPQRGIGLLPKRGCDVTTCEVARFYRLNSLGLCQVISMTVPRKSELFQVDLYPPTLSSTPALTAEDWFSGYNANPVMISMQTGCEILNEHRDENDLGNQTNQLSDNLSVDRELFHSKSPDQKLIRASSLPGHTPLNKNLSLPVQMLPTPTNDNNVLFDEIYQLKAQVAQLEERICIEDAKQEERIAKLEKLVEVNNIDCAYSRKSLNPDLEATAVLRTEPQVNLYGQVASKKGLEENRDAVYSFTEETTSLLSTLLASPLTSISSIPRALSAQLPLLSSTSIVTVPILTSLKAWSFLRNSVSTISSSLSSSKKIDKS